MRWLPPSLLYACKLLSVLSELLLPATVYLLREVSEIEIYLAGGLTLPT